MTPALTTQVSSPTLEYFEHNMDITYAFHMYMTSERVSAFVYAVPFVFIALTEGVVKNGLFLIYNAIAFTLNTIIDVVAKVSELAMSCFCEDDEDDEVQRGHDFNTERHPAAFDSSDYIQNIDQIQPAAVAEPERIIPSAYSADDLITLKFVMKEAASLARPIEITKDGLQCRVRYDGWNHVLHIENLLNQSILKLKITDQGQFSSICLNGVDQDHFPEDFDLCIKACFEKAFEVSSSYTARRPLGALYTDEYGRPLIFIRTLRESLSRFPVFHLEQLVSQLASVPGRSPFIRVNFLERNLENNVAIDAGGPSRDWLDTLMKALTQNSSDLRFVIEGGGSLKLPATATEYEDGPLPPTLSDEGRKICKEIGQLMLFAHQTHRREYDGDQQRELMIGNLFEKGLYEAMFSLTVAEREVGFNQLSEGVLLKMAHAIFRARNTPTEVIHLLGCMLPLDQRYALPLEEDALEQMEYMMPGPMSQQRQRIWREAHEWAKMSREWTPIENFDPTRPTHRLRVRNGLARLQDPMTQARWARAHALAQGSIGWQFIANFDPTNEAHQLQVQNGLKKLLWAQVGESLDPIHAMAQGMLCAERRCHVDLSRETPTQFCDKIQGTISRVIVANSLKALDGLLWRRTAHFNTQLDWLKNWVLNDATSDQVTALVQYATGASTLPIGGTIFVDVQSGSPAPMPRAHTCFNRIDLAPVVCNLGGYSNATQEQFIEALQYALRQTEHTAR